MKEIEAYKERICSVFYFCSFLCCALFLLLGSFDLNLLGLTVLEISVGYLSNWFCGVVGLKFQSEERV